MYPDAEPTPGHAPDGEFRFIHRAIRGSRRATARAEETLTALDGVIKATANAHTGEIYVVFEPSVVAVDRILRSLAGVSGSPVHDETDHAGSTL